MSVVPLSTLRPQPRPSQGESASSGAAAEGDVVARVIGAVIRCGESAQPALQLAVIRALLTFSTAEHFVAHGECLLAAVRMVFNLALAAEEGDIRRAASNALLQVGSVVLRMLVWVQQLGALLSAVVLRG